MIGCLSLSGRPVTKGLFMKLNPCSVMDELKQNAFILLFHTAVIHARLVTALDGRYSGLDQNRLLLGFN